MAKRPALIFDFGNVLVFFDYTKAGQALGLAWGSRARNSSPGPAKAASPNSSRSTKAGP